MRTLKALRARARQDERGLTLIELLLAMSIVGMVLTMGLLIFTSSVRTQNDIQNTVTQTGQAQTMMATMSEAVRTASAFRVTNSTRIDLRTPDGRCQAWAVANGSLYRKTSTVAVGSTVDSTWRRLVFPITPIGATPYFAPATGTGVAYSLNTGEGVTNIDMVGNVTPRAVGTSSAPCW